MNWTYLLVCFTAATAPGPGVLALIHYSLNRGVWRSIPLMLGMQVGLLVAAVVAGSGIGAIVFASPSLFWWFSLAGGGYLCYYGVAIILPTLRAAIWQPPMKHIPGNGFLVGILIALANPKTIFFFMAVLPQFLEGSAAFWMQISQLAWTLMVVTLIVHLFYAYVAQWASTVIMRYVGTINRFVGLAFLALGLSIIYKAW